MSEGIFQWSLIGLTILVIGWMVAGIILGIMAWGWVVVIGILVEMVIGGALIYYWGKGYMQRRA